MNRSCFGAFALVCLVLAYPATASADTGSVVGKWLAHAETPQGPLELTFDFRMDGDRMVGTVTVHESVMPASALKFEDPQLTLQINFLGGDYRIAGALKDDTLVGGWEQIGGEMKGTWKAERAAAENNTATAPSAPGAAGIEGTWNSVAASPDGELPFTIELKRSGPALEGKITAGAESVPLEKVTFSDGKLSFQVEYAGGLYRIEATLAGDKLTGKWSSIDGTDSGAFSADRGRP